MENSEGRPFSFRYANCDCLILKTQCVCLSLEVSEDNPFCRSVI